MPQVIVAKGQNEQSQFGRLFIVNKTILSNERKLTIINISDRIDGGVHILFESMAAPRALQSITTI